MVIIVDNKKIIIILLVIIVVLALAVGIMLFQDNHVKNHSKIKITNDKTQYEDGEISIQLTDLNKTAISKEIVNITIEDKDGKIVVDSVVKTDSEGMAKLDIDLNAGEYVVNASYGGNENYTGNSTSQKLTIEKEVVEATPQTSSSSTTYNGRDLSGGSGESVIVENVDEESGVIEGYKGGRKGIWTPSGNFIEEGGGY